MSAFNRSVFRLVHEPGRIMLIRHFFLKLRHQNFWTVSHNLIIPGRSTRQDAGGIIKSPIKSESINFVIWFLAFSRLILKFVIIIHHCSITANVMSVSDSINSLIFENSVTLNKNSWTAAAWWCDHNFLIFYKRKQGIYLCIRSIVTSHFYDSNN